ncbi:porin family protein [Tenacibaculum sp. MEBiC06402]|uniref:porin family protein n=1 Tax=unclassified Tenacibaculum TaxID=2635139 RepID=UPI003B9C8A1B
MKKIPLLLTVCFLSFTNYIAAQNVDFGLKGGLNIANVNVPDIDEDLNNLLSFHVGTFAEFKFNEKISLQPELLYTRQGSEVVENNSKVKIDYLAMPILAKYYFFENLSLEVGPQISFLINDKIEYIDSSIPDEETDASSFDFSLNFGLGYNLGSNMIIQTRYCYGVSAVYENPDAKNSVFQISLGYKF